MTEPGSPSTTPVPIAIEHAEPGGGQLDEPKLIVDLVIVVGVKTERIRIEGLGAVDIGDGDGDEFELEVHAGGPFGGGRHARILSERSIPFQPKGFGRCATPHAHVARRAARAGGGATARRRAAYRTVKRVCMPRWRCCHSEQYSS